MKTGRLAEARAKCVRTAGMLAAVWVVAIGTAGSGVLRAQNESVVTVAREPQQQMSYGMDFEPDYYWKGLKEKQRLAEAAVRDCQVDYIRIPVNPAAEPKEGAFDERQYARTLETMALMRTARPDIKFFASPRPIGVSVPDTPMNCFPLWISGDHSYRDSKGRTKWKRGQLDSENAAAYMVRYVRFMKSKGFTITYLDLKNESCVGLRPAAIAAMAVRIREQLGEETPLLLGPSSWNYSMGRKWVQEAIDGTPASEGKPAVKGPGTDFFDILSMHNTPGEAKSGSLDDFVALGKKLNKPVWNTELHGFRGNDTLAVTNTAILFNQIRKGVWAVNDWLSLGNEKKDYKMFRALDDGSLEIMRIYYIYKQLVNTSGGGRYVPTTVPEGLTSSAAFLRDDLMTVWLLNGTDKPASGVTVKLEGRTIGDGPVKTVWWGPDTGREGRIDAAKPAAASALRTDVGAKTLICFEFKVK